MKPTLPRACVLAATGVIAAYFVYFSIASLLAEFTHDDLMNCYRAWSYPLGDLLADNLFFFRFSPMYRPFGAVAYKASFWLFGFELLPLRAVLLLVLAGNVFLVYKLTRLLTDSVEAGLLAALLQAYHMKLAPLLYNTGTLYDVFVFFFYFAALLLYVSIRRTGRSLGVPHGLAIVALYVLALDSKELAASLPLALVSYELLWHPPSLTKDAVVRFLTRQTWIIWITAAMTLAFAKGRVLNEEGGITNVGSYGVTISAGEYLTKLAFYLNEAFYSPNWLDVMGTAVFVVVLLAVAAVIRWRALGFGALLLTTGVLPMAFIDLRALSAVTIPFAGLSIYAAVLLALAADGLRRLVPRPKWQPLAFFVVFGLTAVILVRVHPDNVHIYVASDEQYKEIRTAREQIQKLHPEFPSGSRILVLETPFPRYSPSYNNLFLMRLAYRDISLDVEERAMVEKEGRPLIPDNYDYLVSYENGRWRDVAPEAVEGADTTGEPAN